MLSSAIRAELAAELADAERTRVPMSPLTAAHPGIDVVDAYEIQLINIRRCGTQWQHKRCRIIPTHVKDSKCRAMAQASRANCVI